ncbi:MAG: CDP-glycerol glycerophosphotransferase family protein, partial [Lachnospiraceae bacterium]|nr:CDP-glycerol glycerophosphotransferase family protein [Lachnospiraceae bacterium]
MNDRMKDSGVSATIHAIIWDRIHLYMEMSVQQSKNEIPLESLDVFAVNKEGLAGALFDTKILENGSVQLYVNITNNGLHECVPAGTYRLFVCHGNDILCECEAEIDLTKRMEELSRPFLFGTRRREYSVSFLVVDDRERLLFRMHMMPLNYQKMGFPYTFSLWKSLSSTLHSYFLETRRNIRRYYQLICKFQGNKKKTSILFMTEQSATLGSNLKCVYDRMIERGLDKEYTIRTWARKVSAGGYSPLNWLKFANLVAKSGIIFIDDHVPPFDWMPLENTILIQTWHAGAGFKSSGYARWGQEGGPAPVSCHRQYTYGLCGSKKIAHFFSEVWGINTERVLNTGMPRMDEFQDAAYREKTTKALYEKFPLCKGKKVILFAPTYRGTSNRDAHYPYELIDWKRLDEVCGEEYVVLFKMHPWVIKDIKIPKEYQHK